jgi:hypothetical protein
LKSLILYSSFLGKSYNWRLGRSLCCEPSLARDGSYFFISFTHGDTIHEEMMSGNTFTGNYEEQDENGFAAMFMNFGSDTQTKTHDTPNWVVKFEFNRNKMMIEDPRQVKQQSVLVMQGNVPNVYEFKHDKMVMIASQSLLLFEDW